MYTPMLFKSPIDLPEARSGKLAIVHDTISGKVPIIGMRQALLRGKRPTVTTLARERKIHKLVDDDRGVWMTDMPEELNQIGEVLYETKPTGTVFVGGLGLGILARTLAQFDEVKRIYVVERSEDVLNLCSFGSDRVVFIHGDMYSELMFRKCDYYLLDTWQSTNESTWWSEVMPARRILANNMTHEYKVWCWAEDIMRFQVVNALYMHSIKTGGHWLHRGVNTQTLEEANWFVDNVGTPDWERMYGEHVPRAARKVQQT